MVVVLPEPLGPRKPWTSPEATVRSSPSRARVDPNVFTSPDVSIAFEFAVTPRTLHRFHELVNIEEFLYQRPVADDAEQILLQAVERFAVMLDQAGMPRMPARVFAYLVMEDADGFTAGELGEALQVSPAAISGAVRYLIQAGMIVRERNPGARRDHYRLHDDIWYESTLQRVGQLRRWEQLLADTIELVGPERAGSSLLETRAFVAFLQEGYPELMERWRERKRALFGA